MQPTDSAAHNFELSSPSVTRPTIAAEQREQVHSQLRYALITPARNEQELIQGTLDSVVDQTTLPVKWVIVDDGSTDNTGRIAAAYAAKHAWIEVVTMPPLKDRSFANKVRAFNAGYDKVKSLDVDVIANIDADVSFDEHYFEFMLDKFSKDHNLGVAGSVFVEDGYSSELHSCEGQHHVPGGCQLFRKSCFEAIGGYIPSPAGGIDWVAVTTARMRGWTTRSFREVHFFHHRHLGTAERSRVAALFSYGEKDYYFGGHPLWEVFRVAYWVTRQPYIVGALALGSGYGWAMLRRAKRAVSDELMAFHRTEQMRKLNAIFKRLVTGKPLDKFALLAD